ncbi:MAG: S41 family peptidase [Candidatus Pacebacteria bacterium]|nr:S41 family peptidase [Candidatus Paceibacterota bacterium]
MSYKKVFNFVIKAVPILIFCLVVGLAGYQFGFNKGEQSVLKTVPANINEGLGVNDKVDFSVFWEAWRRLEATYIDKTKIDYKKMVYGATQGMVKAIGDPYTTYFTPNETESFNEELNGQYQGVGMVVGIKDEQLTVVSPFKGTPAEQAGIKAGDKILKIEDVFTQDITIEEAVKIIKGKPGTSVKLLIQRDDWVEPKEFTLQRATITIPTLELTEKDGGVAVVKMYQFNKILTSEFAKAANEILNNGDKKIIIDLRDNPGGYLEVSQEIAGWFLNKGEVVVIQDEGTDKEKKQYLSEGPSTFVNYPVVVLINEGSASASEILAGALRDNRNIKLVGAKSFGKGSVQEQIDLSDKSSLKVTIAKWFTPNGTSLDKNGLDPDYLVSSNATSSLDAQMDKALEIINNQ